VHDAIDALARTDADRGTPYFQAEFKKTLELLAAEPRAKSHLEELFVSLLDFKNTERRCSETRTNLLNVAGCFDVLENFARKHINGLPNRNISALPDTAFSGEFANGQQHIQADQQIR